MTSIDIPIVYNNLKAEIASLHTMLAGKEQEIVSLRARVAELEGKLADAEERADEMEGKAGEWIAVEVHKERVESARADAVEMNKRLLGERDAAWKENARISAQVAELTRERDQWKKDEKKAADERDKALADLAAEQERSVRMANDWIAAKADLAAMTADHIRLGSVELPCSKELATNAKATYAELKNRIAAMTERAEKAEAEARHEKRRADAREYVGKSLAVADSNLIAARAEADALRDDALRFRWLLDGHGYFMEENGLCGHAPCSEREKNCARREIDVRRAAGVEVEG